MARITKLTVTDIQEINKIYNEGNTLAYLGYRYKMNPSSISRYIWKPRPRGKQRAITEEIGQAIHKLREQGYSYLKIEKSVGVSRSVVWLYLNK